jgi:hypothetical protein
MLQPSTLRDFNKIVFDYPRKKVKKDLYAEIFKAYFFDLCFFFLGTKGRIQKKDALDVLAVSALLRRRYNIPYI